VKAKLTDKEIGNRIKAGRQQKKMTQVDFGSYICWTPATVVRVENGTRAVLATEVEDVCEVLCLDVRDLLLRRDGRPGEGEMNMSNDEKSTVGDYDLSKWKTNDSGDLAPDAMAAECENVVPERPDFYVMPNGDVRLTSPPFPQMEGVLEQIRGLNPAPRQSPTEKYR